MMKKNIILVIVVLFIVIAGYAVMSSKQPPATTEQSSGESQQPQEASSESGGSELALITDLGTIDDKSFNQGAWEGLLQYAEEKNISHKYYQPSEQSNNAYLEGIDLAVKGGAKVIVTPGFLFETPVFIAQDRYPEVHFILVDGNPHNDDYSTFKTGKNTVGVTYAEEQAGFLAGYAVVKDGMKKLGFMGGMAVPAVVRYGYGFVQGAEFAAEQLGLPDKAIAINYHYTGAFAASPEAQAMAASWYNNGFEVIFACGGAVGNSVMAAAEQADKKVIGVDVDQSSESQTVVISAVKGLKVSVYDCIRDYYDGKFPGGQNLTFDAKNDGIGLSMESSKLTNFTKSDYDAVYARLVDGSVNIVRDTDSAGKKIEVSGLPLKKAAVSEIK